MNATAERTAHEEAIDIAHVRGLRPVSFPLLTIDNLASAPRSGTGKEPGRLFGLRWNIEVVPQGYEVQIPIEEISCGGFRPHHRFEFMGNEPQLIRAFVLHCEHRHESKLSGKWEELYGVWRLHAGSALRVLQGIGYQVLLCLDTAP